MGGGVKVRCPRVKLEAVSGAGEKAVNYMHLGLSRDLTADRQGEVMTEMG